MIRFKSIAEQRLDFAFEKVQEVIEREGSGLEGDGRYVVPAVRKEAKATEAYKEVQKAYHQYVKSFAMLMLNSGLVAALLFAQGKANKGDNKGKAYKLIISHLTAWLKECKHCEGTDKEAIKELYGKNSQFIRLATLEATRFLEDLKRVADARLYKPEEKKKNNE